VEEYFAASGLLSQLYYWVGLSRVSAISPYTWSRDRSTPSQFPSNDPQYAHWCWQHPLAYAFANHDCVLAYSSYRCAGLLLPGAGAQPLLLHP
jgi:hypothetical protein